MTYVLDTNIITALIKNNEKIKMKVQEIIFQGKEIFLNAISFYEIKRGLLAINATKKMKIFETVSKEFGVLLLDQLEIFDKASEIYSELKKAGQLITDADILIAGLSYIKNMILVTNDSDFGRIEDISVENWLNDN